VARIVDITAVNFCCPLA